MSFMGLWPCNLLPKLSRSMGYICAVDQLLDRQQLYSESAADVCVQVAQISLGRQQPLKDYRVVVGPIRAAQSRDWLLRASQE